MHFFKVRQLNILNEDKSFTTRIVNLRCFTTPKKSFKTILCNSHKKRKLYYVKRNTIVT